MGRTESMETAREQIINGNRIVNGNPMSYLHFTACRQSLVILCTDVLYVVTASSCWSLFAYGVLSPVR